MDLLILIRNRALHSRTVPTDSIQARVIIELLTYFNWSHVSVVYTKGVYGEQAFEALVRMADEYDVCFAQKYVIDDTWQSGNYKTMVRVTGLGLLVTSWDKQTLVVRTNPKFNPRMSQAICCCAPTLCYVG